MQKNGLGHTVSTQKTISQTDPAGSRYGPKRDGLVCAKPNRHVLAYISGWGGLFDVSFFALKPCVLACSFAYYKSYVVTNLIFTLQGAKSNLIVSEVGFFFAKKIHSLFDKSSLFDPQIHPLSAKKDLSILKFNTPCQHNANHLG